MEPSSDDNPIARFGAYWWALGTILLFFGVLLITRMIIGGGTGESNILEDTARSARLETRKKVDEAQHQNLGGWVLSEDKQTVHATPSAVFPMLAKQLAETKPVASNDPAQVVPGSATAEKLASEGGEFDAEGINKLSPPEGTKPEAAVMTAGEQGYMLCMACHGQDGKGMEAVAPPFEGSEIIAGPASNPIRILLRGLEGPIMIGGKEYTFAAPMAPLGATMSDEDLAAVLTYIRNSFGHASPPILPEQVKMARGEVGKPTLTHDDLITP